MMIFQHPTIKHEFLPPFGTGGITDAVMYIIYIPDIFIYIYITPEKKAAKYVSRMVVRRWFPHNFQFSKVFSSLFVAIDISMTDR